MADKDEDEFIYEQEIYHGLPSDKIITQLKADLAKLKGQLAELTKCLRYKDAKATTAEKREAVLVEALEDLAVMGDHPDIWEHARAALEVK